MLDTTEWLIHTMYTQGFSGGLVVKNLPANSGDLDLIPGSGSFPREGNGNPLQYSCQENPMDRGTWWATVHRIARVRPDLENEQPGECMPQTLCVLA